MSSSGVSESALPIRTVADRNGVPLSTLHYWERRGLVTPVRIGGRRWYDDEQQFRVALIRLWQTSCVMSLDEIETVLEGAEHSQDWRGIVQRRIDRTADTIAKLSAANEYLRHLLDCPEANPLTCPVLRDQIAERPNGRTPGSGAVSGANPSTRGQSDGARTPRFE